MLAVAVSRMCNFAAAAVSAGSSTDTTSSNDKKAVASRRSGSNLSCSFGGITTKFVLDRPMPFSFPCTCVRCLAEGASSGEADATPFKAEGGTPKMWKQLSPFPFVLERERERESKKERGERDESEGRERARERARESKRGDEET
jgi:hypothetical protein